MSDGSGPSRSGASCDGGIPCRWVAVAVLLLGVLILARAQRYYGGLLRGWDAQHYYALAHSIVFDRDVDITGNLEATPFSEAFDRDGNGSFEAVDRDQNGRIVSKYPAGLSLLEVPFLAIGHGVRRALAAGGITSARPPGYGDVEIWAVALGLLATCAVGCHLLCVILRPYVPSPWRELAIIAAWSGTSLMYYAAVFPFMAHAVGFTLVVWTVYVAESVRTGTRPVRSLWGVGVGLALLYLLRPQEVLIGLPLLLLLRPVADQPAHRWAPWAAAALVAVVAAIVLQAWVHAEMAGNWTANLAMEAEFRWWHPDFRTVLISPARGLLWISPIVLLALLGFAIPAPAGLPPAFAVFALHGLMQIVVIACWRAPQQGDAFGARMWAECAAAVACGLGLLYARGGPLQRLLATIATATCLAWTNRLLMLYVSGRLPLDVSYAECVRRALGV